MCGQRHVRNLELPRSMLSGLPQISRAPMRLPLAVVQEKAAAGDDQPDWTAARCLFAATATAAVAGIPLGLLLGYWSGTGQAAHVPWVGLVQAHGQTQLYGWLGLSVLGVTFHAMAHLFRTEEPPARLTWAVLLLQLAGVLLRLLAPLAGTAGGAAGSASGWLLLGSALAFLGAFGVTLEAHVTTLPRRSRGGRAPAVLPRFLLSGLLLWALALLVNFDASVQALRNGLAAPGAIDPAQDGLVVALTAGGLALIATGMSLRVVVGWLDLPAPDLARATQAWWPLATAALIRGIRPGLEGTAPAAGAFAGVLGDALWVLGVVWYLPALRGLWSPGAVRRGGGRRGESDPPLAWFVRFAYAWLAISALLAAIEAALISAGGAAGPLSATAVADAGRHALLFGFLGTLTAGLTGRLPTAFLEVGDRGVQASRGAYRATFWLLLVATFTRVLAPLAGDGRTVALVIAGTAGALALLSLLLACVQMAALAPPRALPART